MNAVFPATTFLSSRKIPFSNTIDRTAIGIPIQVPNQAVTMTTLRPAVPVALEKFIALQGVSGELEVRKCKRGGTTTPTVNPSCSHCSHESHSGVIWFDLIHMAFNDGA